MLKPKHKDTCTPRMAHLTQFSIPALLNPMINKIADEASAILLLICSHEVWVKVAYDWSTTLCLWAQSIQPKFPETSVQNSMDRFGPTGKVSKKRVHLLRWITFPGRTGWNGSRPMLVLMSTQFSLAYTCACA